MNEMTKESKFLDAINRYAEQQKAQITQEIEDYKNTKIEQATEQGLQDAYDLIREDIASRKAAIVKDVTKRQLELRNGLFAERQAICDKVFNEAEKELCDFAQSGDYTAFLERSLQQIAERFGSLRCIVSVSPKDEDKGELIRRMLPEAEIKADKRILIGGVKAYCPEQGVMMDDTLDTRLADQRMWFIENSGLKVV